MANTAITWTIEADFDKDGTYETDLTGYVSQPGGRVNIRRGLTADGVYQVSRLSLALRNTDGTFTRGNSASALYGLLDPEVPIRVKAAHLGVTYTRWAGYIKSYAYSWGAALAAQCVIACEDIAAYLPTQPSLNVLALERTSGAALTAIATALGLSSDEYDFATGQATFPWHWVRNQDAMTAMMDCIRSEMGGGLFVNGDGVLVSEDRRSRLGLSRLAQQQLRDGPVLLLPFREATGTVAYDYSGNSHNGAYQASPALGATALEAGSPYTSVDLESGSSQYISIADHADLDVADTFTIEALVKPEAIGAAMAITSKGSGEFYVNVNASGNVVLEKTGVGAIVASTTTLSAGTVYHVVVTKSGATVKIYVDGVDVSDTVSNQTMTTSANEMLVGVLVGGTAFFDGLIASFALYPTALSATRVVRHYYAYKYGAWGDGTTIFPTGIDLEIDDHDLIATATVQGQIIGDDDVEQVIFEFSRNGRRYGGGSADSISIAAGGQYGPFSVDYAGPIVSLTTPVASYDYTGNSAIDGTGTDLTSDLTVTVTDLGAGAEVTIKNTGASLVYITWFQLRGLIAIARVDRPQFTTTKAIAGNVASQGVQVFIPFATETDTPPKAQDYSHALARRYRWPYERLTLTMPASDDTKKAALLALELGDLVRYTDTAVGVNQEANVAAGAYIDDWFYVESMGESLVPGEAQFGFPMVVTLVPSWLYRDLDRIAYDLFTRDNASGDLGTALCATAWANDTGYDISSNAARANTDTLSMATLELGTLAFDHVVEVSLSNISTGDEVGLVARYVDANNQYRAYLDKGSNEVILEKNIGGAVTELSSPAFTVGTSHELRLMVQGNRFRVWVDRELMIDTTDAALNTGTIVGLFARNASGTTTFDDFYAEGL